MQRRSLVERRRAAAAPLAGERKTRNHDAWKRTCSRQIKPDAKRQEPRWKQDRKEDGEAIRRPSQMRRIEGYRLHAAVVLDWTAAWAGAQACLHGPRSPAQHSLLCVLQYVLILAIFPTFAIVLNVGPPRRCRGNDRRRLSGSCNIGRSIRRSSSAMLVCCFHTKY